jgi:hypothetical protein
MPGFSEHIAALQALKDSAPLRGQEAVTAALYPIAPTAEELAPKRTFLLASTILLIEPPEVQGTKIIGTVNAGSSETVRPWHGGTGYELFQEFGTSNGVPAIHYLEIATLEAMNGMTDRMAEAL